MFFFLYVFSGVKNNNNYILGKYLSGLPGWEVGIGEWQVGLSNKPYSEKDLLY